MSKSDSDKRDTGINNSEVDSKDWTKIKYIYKWVLYRAVRRHPLRASGPDARQGHPGPEAEAETLIAASRARANEITKKTEEELKFYRETALREAEARVQKEAERTLSEHETKETKAADALLKDTSGTVSQIVRRVTDGNRRHA